MKIGILIQDSLSLEAWQLATYNRLSQSALCTEIIFLIVPELKEQKKLPFLLRFYLKFERAWFRKIENAFKRSDINDLVYTHRSLRIPEGGHLSADIQKEIEELDLVYGFDDVRYQTILNIAKFGYWNIHFGSKLPAYEEVMKNYPVMQTKLNIYLPNSVHTVYKAITATIPYSIMHSRYALAWKSSEYILFRLKELSLLGAEQFFRNYPVSENAEALNVPTPGNATVLFHIILNCYRYLRFKTDRSRETFQFGLYYQAGTFQPEHFNLQTFQKITLPSKGFQADPFIVSKSGLSYIFFEDFNVEKDKAHISVVVVDAKGKISEAVQVLEADYHLSYPFIFNENGKWFMIPESSDNCTVDLYVAEDFPTKWKFVRHLMKDIVLRDATLIKQEGRWWLFASSASFDFDSGNDQLFLYSTNDLFSGDWKPHPQNPIVTDISNCRPAGSIFSEEGRLYRPAQNNASFQYGYGLNINQIIELNEHSYREQTVFKITPSEKDRFRAVHTINFNEYITVIDGISSKKATHNCAANSHTISKRERIKN